ncbi:MAG: hypothetical protein ACRELX_11705, partial [Longimicrobiales bacterium]
MIPLRDTGPADFAALRALLVAAGYTAAGVLERTGTTSLADARDRQDQRQDLPIADARDALLRLFLDERAIARAAAERVLAGDSIALFERIGLVERRDDGEAKLVPAVMLYPVEDVFLASDLTRDPAQPMAPYTQPDDAVYPAITRNTGDFLSLLPRTPCARFLELCGGTGVAAIIAAPATEIAVTADITERSTQFAEWNAKLNRRTNVRAVRG